MRGALIAGWLVVVLVGYSLATWQQQVFSRPLIRNDRGASVLLDALGEGKTLMARYFYFKAEIYHEVLDMQGVPHTKQKQLIPLLRMVTYLDPSLTETFDLLAWDLWRGWDRKEEALSLLDEATRYNPTSFQLWFRKGFILFHTGDYEDAIAPLEEAVSHASEEFDILNANRLKFWNAKKLDRRRIQREALNVLLEWRPQDPLWRREIMRLDEEEKDNPPPPAKAGE